MVLEDGPVVIQIDADASGAEDTIEGLTDSLRDQERAMRSLTRAYTEQQTSNARLTQNIRELRMERAREGDIIKSLIDTRRRNGQLTSDEIRELSRAGTARNRLTKEIQRETMALEAGRNAALRYRESKDQQRRAIDTTKDAVDRLKRAELDEVRAAKASADAKRRQGIEIAGLNIRTGWLRFGFDRLTSIGWRLNGLFGGLVLSSAHLGRAGLDKLVESSGDLNERLSKAPGLLAKFKTAIIGVGIAVAGLVGSFALLSLGIANLTSAVERIDQVAIAAPTLSDREIQQFAFAGRALGLQGEDIARSAQFIQTGAQRGIEALRVPEEERTPAQNRLLRSFGFFGVTPQQLLRAEAGQAYTTILRRIEERGVQNPEVITNLLPLTGGEQRRATQLASRAREVDRIENLFGTEPIADTLEDLRRIPRALGRISAEFNRLFATIGAGQGFLGSVLEWTADFLGAAADIVKRTPFLADAIGFVLVGATLLLAASLIKAAVAAGLLNLALLPYIVLFVGIAAAIYGTVRAVIAIKNAITEMGLSWETAGLRIEIASHRIANAWERIKDVVGLGDSGEITMRGRLIREAEGRITEIAAERRAITAQERARERFELEGGSGPLNLSDLGEIVRNTTNTINNYNIPIEVNAPGADRYEVEDGVRDGVDQALRSQPYSR